ncbi:MAG: 30S ribosomal protein S9 [Patescibacteria group bacterium]|nr:30S ribosomal protein S9 [Patescibacteria group bacterium]
MQDKNISKKADELPEFRGRFIPALGKRKTAVAQIRLYKNGKGVIVINQQKISQYFSVLLFRTIVSQPLKLSGHLRDLDFSILVKGGGKKAQAEAIRHGIARALIQFDKELKSGLKTKGWLTRDARKKERKKPGLKKARRAPQWSKR